MKLKFIDWEVEKEFTEDFWGYDFRYQLEELVSSDGVKCVAKNLISSNKFEEVIKFLNYLAISNEVEFVENASLRQTIWGKGVKL